MLIKYLIYLISNFFLQSLLSIWQCRNRVLNIIHIAISRITSIRNYLYSILVLPFIEPPCYGRTLHNNNRNYHVHQPFLYATSNSITRCKSLDGTLPLTTDIPNMCLPDEILPLCPATLDSLPKLEILKPRKIELRKSHIAAKLQIGRRSLLLPKHFRTFIKSNARNDKCNGELDDIETLLHPYVRRVVREEIQHGLRPCLPQNLQTDISANLQRNPHFDIFSKPQLHFDTPLSTDKSLEISFCLKPPPRNTTRVIKGNHTSIEPSTIVLDPSLPSPGSQKVYRNQCYRGSNDQYCNQIRELFLRYKDANIDAVIRNSLPTKMTQIEDLEDFVLIIQRRQIPWTKVALWMASMALDTWSLDLITLYLSLCTVIPNWRDRKAFVQTFQGQCYQLLCYIFEDPLLCNEHKTSLFFASFIKQNERHQIDWFIQYFSEIRFTAKLKHQMLFIHKLLYNLASNVGDSGSMNQSMNSFGNELVSCIIHNREDSNDEILMLSDSLNPSLQEKLIGAIKNPLALLKLIDDKWIWPPHIDDIAKSILSLISRPGYAKAFGQLLASPKVGMLSRRVRELFSETLLVLISHSSDCFHRSHLIEFLSYLISTYSEDDYTEIRSVLHQLGNSPSDKRISLWMLQQFTESSLHQISGAKVSKGTTLYLITEELKKVGLTNQCSVATTPLQSIDSWTFLH